MLEKYRAEAEQDVVERAIKKVEIETAQRMLEKSKLPLETIADYSGLPLEEVLQLKQA